MGSCYSQIECRCMYCGTDWNKPGKLFRRDKFKVSICDVCLDKFLCKKCHTINSQSEDCHICKKIPEDVGQHLFNL